MYAKNEYAMKERREPKRSRSKVLISVRISGAIAQPGRIKSQRRIAKAKWPLLLVVIIDVVAQIRKAASGRAQSLT